MSLQASSDLRSMAMAEFRKEIAILKACRCVGLGLVSARWAAVGGRVCAMQEEMAGRGCDRRHCDLEHGALLGAALGCAASALPH